MYRRTYLNLGLSDCGQCGEMPSPTTDATSGYCAEKNGTTQVAIDEAKGEIFVTAAGEGTRKRWRRRRWWWRGNTRNLSRVKYSLLCRRRQSLLSVHPLPNHHHLLLHHLLLLSLPSGCHDDLSCCFADGGFLEPSSVGVTSSCGFGCRVGYLSALTGPTIQGFRRVQRCTGRPPAKKRDGREHDDITR